MGCGWRTACMAVTAVTCRPHHPRCLLTPPPDCLPPLMLVACLSHHLQACATRWVSTSTPPLATSTSRTTAATVSCRLSLCCLELPVACCLLPGTACCLLLGACPALLHTHYVLPWVLSGRARACWLRSKVARSVG